MIENWFCTMSLKQHIAYDESVGYVSSNRFWETQTLALFILSICCKNSWMVDQSWVKGICKFLDRLPLACRYLMFLVFLINRSWIRITGSEQYLRHLHIANIFGRNICDIWTWVNILNIFGRNWCYSDMVDYFIPNCKKSFIFNYLGQVTVNLNIMSRNDITFRFHYYKYESKTYFENDTSLLCKEYL